MNVALCKKGLCRCHQVEMTGTFIRRGKFGNLDRDRHTQGECFVKTETNSSIQRPKKKTPPRTVNNDQKPRERHGKLDSSLRSSRRNQHCLHLTFRYLVSRTMQEKKKFFFFKAICCLQYFITVALGKEYSSEQIQWIIRPERRLRSYNMVDEDVKCRI